MNSENRSENSRLAAVKKLARELLTTTCLTAVAAGMAHASTFNETSVGDFSNAFGTANSLPGGTDRVLGQLTPFGDNDYFKLVQLLGGAPYTIAGAYTNFQTVTVFNSGGGVLNPATVNPASLTGTVPGDGILVLGIQQSEGTTTYDFQLTATSVPEPATAAGAGLALAAGLALRRKSR